MELEDKTCSPGKLVIIDGWSGTGKTTLIRELTACVDRLNKPVSFFCEEEADPNREEILQARQEGKARGGTGDREMAEALIAHRRALYTEHVEPEISRGTTVIAERGEPATLAYQTISAELSMDQVWEKHRRAGIRKPNGVLITRCRSKLALERQERSKQKAKSERRRLEAGNGLSGKISGTDTDDREKNLAKAKTFDKQYKRTAEFLLEHDVQTRVLDTEILSLPKVREEAIKFINKDL